MGKPTDVTHATSGSHTDRPRLPQQSFASQETKRTEVWTQKLQFVVLNGDRILFYSAEVDPPYNSVSLHLFEK